MLKLHSVSDWAAMASDGAVGNCGAPVTVVEMRRETVVDLVARLRGVPGLAVLVAVVGGGHAASLFMVVE